MKWNEMERKGMIFPDILHFFSDILHFSPKMTAKTTENDRKQPRKRVIRQEVEE